MAPSITQSPPWSLSLSHLHHLLLLLLLLHLLHTPLGIASYHSASLSGVLHPLQWLQSANGLYKLSMHSSCNLVLSRASGLPLLWASNTTGSGRDCVAVMESDGNFAIYTSDGRVAWASNTSSDIWQVTDVRYRLWLQDDGNLVVVLEVLDLRATIWATNTKEGLPDAFDLASVTNSELRIVTDFLSSPSTGDIWSYEFHSRRIGE